MKSNIKYVYVMYDPLHERVLCVHEEENMTCDKCKDIGDNHGYGISQKKCKVEPSQRTRRDNRLNELGI
jgi:hypothetical protein